MVIPGYIEVPALLPLMAEIGPIAPEHLRRRVAGTPDEQWFNDSGALSVGEWLRLLTCLGRDIGEFETVVDWGCGCGRALRHLATKLNTGQHLIGMDVDAEAVTWVRANYPDLTLFALAENPPTPLSVQSVDLVVSHSIFTHLPEDIANAWLAELARILKPGGLLITTFHGDSIVKQFQSSGAPEFIDIMNNYGFYHEYSRSEVEEALPQYYGAACHSISYIAKHWTKWFTIRAWIPTFALNYQDSLVLERIAGDPRSPYAVSTTSKPLVSVVESVENTSESLFGALSHFGGDYLLSFPSGDAPTTAVESSIDFDEEWYLQQNSDVTRDVERGQRASGLEHFLTYGSAEDRHPTPPNGDSKASAPGIAEAPERAAMPAAAQRRGDDFLAPSDLTRSNLDLRRGLIVGSCFLWEILWAFEESHPDGCPLDVVIVNNIPELPDRSRDEILQYDFQVLQVQLRSVIGDTSLPRISYADHAAYETLFHKFCDNLEFELSRWMKYNTEYGLLTFVQNFLLPQENASGRLLPRHDLRNPTYLINKLNECMERIVLSHQNAYILDIDKISASLGRRYIQDDTVMITSHNALVPTWEPVSDRLEGLAEMSSYYDIRWDPAFKEAVWAELTAMLRIIRQVDTVKLVAVDLDDTLWAGVSGEMNDVGPFMIEGWPLALMEALLYLKQRGVLLAIVSKNSETRIREIWDQIFLRRVSLDDFAAVRINWQSKTENMREIIEVMNILPSSVVFIDDNPAERAEMQQAFPDMRILGQNPYYLRRILLWAPETQVPWISDESRHRTEMIQAQFSREVQRKTVSRAEFLATAAPKVKVTRLATVADPRFNRALELVNKTNQFNTTGRRWRLEECAELLGDGGTIWTFEVSDSFTNYGLVGVVIVRGRTIEQWVMSCRVIGYQIEEAIMARIISSFSGAAEEVVGKLINTAVNLPCRDLFTKCGFEERAGDWVLPAGARLDVPTHLTMLEE